MQKERTEHGVHECGILEYVLDIRRSVRQPRMVARINWTEDGVSHAGREG